MPPEAVNDSGTVVPGTMLCALLKIIDEGNASAPFTRTVELDVQVICALGLPLKTSPFVKVTELLMKVILP